MKINFFFRCAINRELGLLCNETRINGHELKRKIFRREFYGSFPVSIEPT